MSEVIETRLAAVERLVEALGSAERAVALTGAGASAPSGVPTYRGAGGQWTRYDPARYASAEGFRHDPSYYWSFFRDERAPALQRAGPNSIHTALAQLERAGRLAAVVTQNIDGLHQQGGSSRVIELHGNSRRFPCQRCSAVLDNEQVRALLEQSLPPKCPECQAEALRPDVVFFGEVLNEQVLSQAFEVASEADLMLVIGSSLVVEPAASLPIAALGAGADLVVINIDPTPADRLASFIVRVPADEVVPEAARKTVGEG